MESISIGGRPVAGFALGQPCVGMRGRGCEVQTLLGVGDTGSIAASPRYASVMTGAAVGLLAYVLQAPLWASILLGAGGAITTKYVIDQSAGGPAPSPSTTV